MIVIPRFEGEALSIGEHIKITVLEIDGDDVLLQIDVPDETLVEPAGDGLVVVGQASDPGFNL